MARGHRFAPRRLISLVRPEPRGVRALKFPGTHLVTHEEIVFARIGNAPRWDEEHLGHLFRSVAALRNQTLCGAAARRRVAWLSLILFVLLRCREDCLAQFLLRDILVSRA